MLVSSATGVYTQLIQSSPSLSPGPRIPVNVGGITTWVGRWQMGHRLVSALLTPPRHTRGHLVLGCHLPSVLAGVEVSVAPSGPCLQGPRRFWWWPFPLTTRKLLHVLLGTLAAAPVSLGLRSSLGCLRPSLWATSHLLSTVTTPRQGTGGLGASLSQVPPAIRSSAPLGV